MVCIDRQRPVRVVSFSSEPSLAQNVCKERLESGELVDASRRLLKAAEKQLPRR